MSRDIKDANVRAYKEESESYDRDSGRHFKDLLPDIKRALKLLSAVGVKGETPSILEIGAGTGFTREILSLVRPKGVFTATDISAEMLEEYGRKFGGTERIVCDAEKLPFEDNKFDIVACSSFLHHLPTDDLILGEAARVLKPRGVFLGLREPRMHGCDGWFRVRHLARRYGDREGFSLLLKRVLGGPEGRKMVWSHELAEEEFRKLDLQEIRGSVLHPTPTKEKGGIDMEGFRAVAERHFSIVRIVPFGFLETLTEVYSLLFRKQANRKIVTFSCLVDGLLRRLSGRFPFESFCFACRLKGGEH